MNNPASFSGLSSSILPSQEFEARIAKQSALYEHGQQTLHVLSRLPQNTVNELIADYKAPSPQALDAVSVSIAEREHIIESAQKGQNLDMDWISNSPDAMRRMDEAGLSLGDSWNEGQSI